jgi:hypothetical protein
MSTLLTSLYNENEPNLNSATVSAVTTGAGDYNNFVVTFSAAPLGMFIGACYTANSVTFSIVASMSILGTVDNPFIGTAVNYLVDCNVSAMGSTQTPAFKSIASYLNPALVSTYTVQYILNYFLSSITQIGYSFVIASLVQVIKDNPSFYITSKGRILCTIDDGSVFIDTSKMLFTSSLVYSANQCTFVNFNKKITIANTLSYLNGSNAFTESYTGSASGLTLNVSGTFTVGSAGGNNINENHNTRPEVLLALLSSGGVGNALRYSTSTLSVNQYFAIRFGTVTENNIGTVRINAPTTYTV